MVYGHQYQQHDVGGLRQHKEGQHPACEEALHAHAEPGTSARQCLPKHEAGLL